jgi:C4-dicarboxylate-specific signal transduction histidine kinase
MQPKSLKLERHPDALLTRSWNTNALPDLLWLSHDPRISGTIASIMSQSGAQYVRPLMAVVGAVLLVLAIVALTGSDGGVESQRSVIWIAVVAIQLSFVATFSFQDLRRRRAEARIRQNEQGLSLAAASANIGLWIFDIANDRIHATEHCRRILGIGFGAQCSLHTFLDRLHGDDRSVLRNAIQDAVTMARTFEVELRLALPEGEIRWIAASGRAKHDHKGRALSLTGVFVDITDRRSAEADAAEQREHIAYLTRLGLLGELSGAVAHELNQPLAAIVSNAQAAQRMLSQESMDLIELRNTVRDIIDDGGRAGEVIRQLRALLTKGNSTFQTIDLTKVVAEALDLVRGDLTARQVTTVRRLAPNLPPVRGNEVQLKQVILNLAVNAADAMMENEGTDRVLTVSTAQSGGGGVEIVFKDNGTGIPPGVTDRLFDPFFSTKSHGLGLGLWISRSIMTAHGGTIWAENNREEGAAFHLRFASSRSVS